MKSVGGWILGATILAAVGGLPALAQDTEEKGPGELSSTVSFTTDYVFRGISQTDEHPAAQASIDYSFTHSDNFSSYFGIWGSNVDFNDSSEASVEIDLYAGVKPTFGDFQTDIGVIAYLYPGASSTLDYNYFEGKLGLGYDFGFLVLGASAFYSPSYFGHSDDALYLTGSLDVPLPWGITLEGHFGRQWIKDNDKFGTPDYYDWHGGVRLEYAGFTFAARYFDTDIKDSECRQICDQRFVASVSRTF